MNRAMQDVYLIVKTISDDLPLNHRAIHVHYTDLSQASHYCIPDPVMARMLMSDDDVQTRGAIMVKHLSYALSQDDAQKSRAALVELAAQCIKAINQIDDVYND